MLEVHPDPPNAAVDPLQPIDFDELKMLMTNMDNIAKTINRRLF